MTNEEVFPILELGYTELDPVSLGSRFDPSRMPPQKYRFADTFISVEFPFKFFLLGILSAYALFSSLQAVLTFEATHKFSSEYLDCLNYLVGYFWTKLSMAMVFSIWLISENNHGNLELILKNLSGQGSYGHLRETR